MAAFVWLLPAAPVRAEFIPWKYSWTRSPGKVYSDTSNSSYIILTEESPLNPVLAVNETDIVATNLKPVSDADPEHPATFTNKGYTLTLFLLDVQSGQSGTMDFTGMLNGTISEFTAMVRNQFTGDTSQQLILGDNLYEVTIGPYTPPGPPQADNLGSIGAHARVTITQLHKTPEPSTLLLALLGGPAVGYRVWRRRRERASQ
jgi:hypothetical protein